MKNLHDDPQGSAMRRISVLDGHIFTISDGQGLGIELIRYRHRRFRRASYEEGLPLPIRAFRSD